MSKQMSQIYRGLSRRIIQHGLNSMKQQQKIRYLFQNKAPLRSFRASKVRERHQVDLVSMISIPATVDMIGVLHLQKVSENFHWEFPVGKSAFHLPQVPFERAEGHLAV